MRGVSDERRGSAAPAGGGTGGGAAVSAGAFDGTSIRIRVTLSAVVWTTRGVAARALSATATVGRLIARRESVR